MAVTEVISGDPTRRVFWLNSYGLDVASRPTLPQTSPFTGTETVLFLKSASVSTGTQTVSWAGDFQVDYYAVTGVTVLEFAVQLPNGLHIIGIHFWYCFTRLTSEE